MSMSIDTTALAMVSNVYASTVHLISGGGVTGWPGRNRLASVDPMYGELQMRVVSPTRPVRVTIEAGGERTLVPDAVLTYEGPMTLISDQCAITDGMGSHAWPFQLRDLGMTPGTHHMLVQVTGRIEVAIQEQIETDRLMTMSDEEAAAFVQTGELDDEPIEHWFISFPRMQDKG